jgi:hypothetical protein
MNILKNEFYFIYFTINMFKCAFKKCYFSSTCKKIIEKHISITHKLIIKNYCLICNIQLKNYFKFENHMKIHNYDNEYENEYNEYENEYNEYENEYNEYENEYNEYENEYNEYENEYDEYENEYDEYENSNIFYFKPIEINLNIEKIIIRDYNYNFESNFTKELIYENNFIKNSVEINSIEINLNPKFNYSNPLSLSKIALSNCTSVQKKFILKHFNHLFNIKFI